MNIFKTALALLVGLLLSAGFVALLGEQPLFVLGVLARSAAGSPYDIAMTLVYATPLILTGLAVAIPFRVGLFNIGAEGQLQMGALAAVWTGILLSGVTESAWIARPLIILAALVAGALYAFIPAVLKVRRGSHEVITTILLNFVAYGLTSFAVLYQIPNVESQNPESLSIPAHWMFVPWTWTDQAPLTWFSVAVLVFAGIVTWVFARTWLGLAIQAGGENPAALESVGLSSARVQLGSFVAGGAVSGVVGAFAILVLSGCFKLGFSADYGFAGIAVALLARSNPVGVVFSALLFGALQKGTADLDLETERVTRDLALVIQALIILSVSSQRWRRAK